MNRSTKILILLVVGFLLLWGIVGWWHSDARGHHSCAYFLEEIVKPRESGGDYTAFNVKRSEYHRKWDTTGSFGAYQIAGPLWREEAIRQGLHQWAYWFPHWTPTYIQDQIALGICERYGKCPWLIGDERVRCWKRL